MEEFDVVLHPRHYNTHASGVECIDIVEWCTFNPGNAIKYLWRMSDKGKALEDTRKALWYVEREINRRTHWWKFLQKIRRLLGEKRTVPRSVVEQFYTWTEAEPAGWRKDAIMSLWHGEDNSLLMAQGTLKRAIADGRVD